MMAIKSHIIKLLKLFVQRVFVSLNQILLSNLSY